MHQNRHCRISFVLLFCITAALVLPATLVAALLKANAHGSITSRNKSHITRINTNSTLVSSTSCIVVITAVTRNIIMLRSHTRDDNVVHELRVGALYTCERTRARAGKRDCAKKKKIIIRIESKSVYPEHTVKTIRVRVVYLHDTDVYCSR